MPSNRLQLSTFHAVASGADVRSRRPPAGRALAVLLAALALVACESLDRVVPPVESRLIQLGAQRSHSPQMLQRGRAIYISQCATCHVAEPIAAYTVEQWRSILPDMADRTNLSPQETADVSAYVFTAHEAITSSRLAPAP